MTSTIVGHIPYGDMGSGHYGSWCGPQDIANIDLVKDKILQAVETIPLGGDKGRSVFTIGDYGCADAAVSLPLLTHIIRLVRKKHGEIPVQVVYDDQPSNDFNSVFKRLHGLIPDPPSYLREFQKVFVMASATSFYCQVVPDDSAHLIISFMAVYWSSGMPVKFQDCFHRFPNATEEERKNAEILAAKDWETFLLQRSRELKSGGMLIVSTPAEDPTVRLGGMRANCQSFETDMVDMWRQMMTEGKITREEFVNTNFNGLERNLEECKAPFQDPNSPVSRAGLRLVEAELVLSPCVVRAEWQAKLDREGIDDRATWARDITNQHRCWSNSSFILGLSDERSQSEKEALVDEMYARIQKNMLTQNPAEYKSDQILVYVYARKV